jgi:hypothetical protein
MALLMDKQSSFLSVKNTDSGQDIECDPIQVVLSLSAI